MALSTTMLADDFDYIRDDLPQTITFGTTSVSAVVHDLEHTNDEVGLAGVDVQYALEATYLKTDFTTQPTTGDLVTYSSVQYRVVRWRDSACGLTRSLFLEQVTA